LLSGKLGELTTRQRDASRIATSSGRRLRSFIDELLEFSRYELTREHLSFGPVSVSDLLHQATKAIARGRTSGRFGAGAARARHPGGVGRPREAVQVLMNS